MTVVTGSDPYDLSKLLKGPCRFLRLPYEKTAPTKLIDILEVEGEYKPKTEWVDFGATTSGGAYGRQLQTAGYQIEQTTGNVDEEVTDAVRTVQGNFAELDSSFIQIMEQASSVATVAAAAGYSEEKQVKVGTIQSLTSYRIAIVARRGVGLGSDVKQKDGTTRGAMVAYVMYRAKITADQAAIQLARGQLASAPITFQAYPEPGKTQGQEHGFWIFEQAGTIT